MCRPVAKRVGTLSVAAGAMHTSNFSSISVRASEAAALSFLCAAVHVADRFLQCYLISTSPFTENLVLASGEFHGLFFWKLLLLLHQVLLQTLTSASCLYFQLCINYNGAVVVASRLCYDYDYYTNLFCPFAAIWIAVCCLLAAFAQSARSGFAFCDLSLHRLPN